MRRLALLAGLGLALTGTTAQAQDAATAPTKTAIVNGKPVGYRSIGTGRPIVFVMGLGGTMDAWDPAFVDRVARQGRRVIVFDNEGIGRSARRSGPITISRMADTTAALISTLKLNKPDVFGWSMGGMIAQSLAVRHPRSINRLVLGATAPGDGKATLPESDVLLSLGDRDGNPARVLSLLFPEGDSSEASRYVVRLTRRKRPNLDVPDAIRQEHVGASGTWIAGNDPDGKKPIRLPVLVAGGERDRVLPVANQRHLANTIPKAQRAIYPDAAHGFFVQHGARFAARVDAFLRRARQTT